MERTEGLGRRLRAAWAVVRGAAPGEAADAGASAAAQARIANLEMDVQERDERIERLRAEFVLQARQSDEAVARAGTGQLQSLAKRAAPLLSQLTTIQTMAEGGPGRPDRRYPEAGRQTETAVCRRRSGTDRTPRSDLLL